MVETLAYPIFIYQEHHKGFKSQTVLSHGFEPLISQGNRERARELKTIRLGAYANIYTNALNGPQLILKITIVICEVLEHTKHCLSL